MRRWVSLLALAVVTSGALGCKTAGKGGPGTSVMNDPQPPLLIGPEAAAKAPPPVELPAKESAQLCVRTAQHYEKDGRTEDAIKLYEKARLADPATARTASRRLAVLYDKAGDFSKSAAEYETQIKAAPNDADLLTDYGYSHYCRGDWPTAENILARAVQVDANNKRAWVNLGLAQAQLGKWDEGFQSFCRAVRPADAHCNLAFVLAAQGKKEEAKEQYRLALALDPSLQLAQRALASIDRPKNATSQTDAREKDEKFDPAIAASRVPSVAEIEAQLKKTKEGTPIFLPASDGKEGE